MPEQTQIVSLSFFRFRSVAARTWAFTQMGLARMAMARIPDAGFWKLFGSGTGEGFTPLPNTGVYAILCTWPDLGTARARLADTPVFARWRGWAAENWTILLETASVRGEWSGEAPFHASGSADGPLAALTRATIRPAKALKFWQRAPAISDAIGADPHVAFKIGLGEVPGFQQVTFSIWPDAASMSRFARQGGPHHHAIKAVRAGGWFKEELYARFRIAGEIGSWEGGSPLSGLPSTQQAA
ncbi:MAG: spheroidene monooxygenase [Pseudomonadota bacterium]